MYQSLIAYREFGCLNNLYSAVIYFSETHFVTGAIVRYIFIHTCSHRGKWRNHWWWHHSTSYENFLPMPHLFFFSWIFLPKCCHSQENYNFSYFLSCEPVRYSSDFLKMSDKSFTETMNITTENLSLSKIPLPYCTCIPRLTRVLHTWNSTCLKQVLIQNI